jgi:hypothetical protein
MTIITIIMKITALFILVLAINTGMLAFSTITLCSPHVNVNAYLCLSDKDANIFIYNKNSAMVVYNEGRVILTSARDLLPSGKTELYMGVKIRVLGKKAIAVVNGIKIAGNLTLVKKSIKAALSGKNMMNYLKSIGFSTKQKNVEALYIFNKKYCPFSSDVKVVWIGKTASGYIVHIYYHGKWTKLHASSIRQSKFYVTKSVRRVLTFTVDSSCLCPHA